MSADRREIDVPLGRTIAFYTIMIVGAAGLFLITHQWIRCQGIR